MASHGLQEGERRRAAAHAHAAAVRGDAARRDGAGVQHRLLGPPPARDLRGRRLGRAALQLPRQVRFRHRVAQLHEAARVRQYPREVGPLPLHGAHRGPLGARRFAPRARVRRRTAADRITLLYELRRAAVHSARAARSGGVRAVPSPLRGGQHASPLTVRPGDWLPLLGDIADRADEIALAFFGAKRLRVETKADASPVTEADRAIETMARALVRERQPALGLLGEEQGEVAAAAGTRLIIDPIDGTRNFVRGIPVFATLLAIETDGDVVAGVVSAPALRARWRAARGAGAFRDARRLRVSGARSLGDGPFFHGKLGFQEGGPPPGFAQLIGCVGPTRGVWDFYYDLLGGG